MGFMLLEQSNFIKDRIADISKKKTQLCLSKISLEYFNYLSTPDTSLTL